MRPNQKRLPSFRFTARLVPLAALLVFCGCGGDIASRQPVTGTVLVDGQPADGAVVTLAPVSAIKGLESLRPTGVADSAGKFSLMTVAQGDGAPAGDYKVMVQWPSPPKFDPALRREATGADRLKGKYSNPDQSNLTVTIEKGSNELKPFELTAK